MTPEQLRASILQYAIQGKLVEQRLEEKRVDLSHIKLKKTEEFEFDIPDGWLTAHLESITKSVASKQYQIAASDFKTTGKYPVVSQSKEYIIGYSDDASKLYRPENPVVIFGDHTTEVKYVDFDFIVGADGVKIFEPIGTIIVGKFLMYLLEFYSIGLEKVGGYSRHYKFIKDKAFPIPPLSEQERIVAKIEELLPYVDRYAAAYEKLEQFNAKFPEDMKKSILQYAIQGKLVEQRPEEGTGEELYQQIQAEKQRLIKEGKIKKEKPLAEIVEDEIPFDIPERWKWVRIGEIFTVIRGSSPRPKGSPLYWSSTPTQHHWVTIKDITVFAQNGTLCQTHEFLTSEGAKKSTFVPEEELVIAVSGSTTGKFCILGIDGYIYDGLAAILNPTKKIGKEYLRYFFMWIYERLNAQKVGSAFPNINTDMLKNTLIPVPPLAEQKRIVAKLEEILPLCERLK